MKKRILCSVLFVVMFVMMITPTISAANVDAVSSEPTDIPTLSFTYLERGISMTVNLPSNQSWYYRYYVRTTNTSWSRIGKDTKSNTCSYSTTNGGTTYYFTVRCVKDGQFLTGFKTHSVYYCNVPGSLTATQQSKGIKVTWDKCYGVSKYRVYRKTIGTSWKAIANVSGGSYVDGHPVCDFKNIYTVRGLDSKGNWCTGYKSAGISCYQGGLDLTVAVVDNIVDGVYAKDRNVIAPDRYWSYSGIPEGADWCTGFANYVIGKSCGSWRFAGEWHSGATWNSDYEESTGHGNYNNPACWHPYTDVWSRWANNCGIFQQPYEYVPKKGDIIFFRSSQIDTFDTVSHVGIVVSATKNTITTVEGNGNGKSASASQVCVFKYNKSGNTWMSDSSNPGRTRWVSGFIKMSDIYNRTIY